MGRVGWIATGAIIALLGLGGAWRAGLLGDGPAPVAGPAAGGPGAGGPPPAVAVDAVRVERGRVVDGIDAVGTLIANEAIVVRPEIQGRVAKILFNEGDKVEAGAPLVELDASTYRAEVDQAQADIGLGKANYERATKLFSQNTGTGRAVDEAAAALRASQARVALAEANLAKTTILAPFAGYVGLRQFSLGDVVTAGQDMMNLASIDPIKVDFRVSETRLPAVKTGQAIDLTVDAIPGRTFRGEVYAIDPVVDAQGRAILLRARVPNGDGALRPGLFARVNLIVAVREDVLLVHEAAIVPMGAKQTVFRVVDGKAVMTEVHLGLRREGKVEVIDGLAPDDTVVTAGQMKLQDGAPVTPTTPAPGA